MADEELVGDGAPMMNDTPMVPESAFAQDGNNVDAKLMESSMTVMNGQCSQNGGGVAEKDQSGLESIKNVTEFEQYPESGNLVDLDVKENGVKTPTSPPVPEGVLIDFGQAPAESEFFGEEVATTTNAGEQKEQEPVPEECFSSLEGSRAEQQSTGLLSMEEQQTTSHDQSEMDDLMIVPPETHRGDDNLVQDTENVPQNLPAPDMDIMNNSVDANKDDGIPKEMMESFSMDHSEGISPFVTNTEEDNIDQDIEDVPQSLPAPDMDIMKSSTEADKDDGIPQEMMESLSVDQPESSVSGSNQEVVSEQNIEPSVDTQITEKMVPPVKSVMAEVQAEEAPGSPPVDKRESASGIPVPSSPSASSNQAKSAQSKEEKKNDKMPGTKSPPKPSSPKKSAVPTRSATTPATTTAKPRPRPASASVKTNGTPSPSGAKSMSTSTPTPTTTPRPRTAPQRQSKGAEPSPSTPKSRPESAGKKKYGIDTKPSTGSLKSTDVKKDTKPLSPRMASSDSRMSDSKTSGASSNGGPIKSKIGSMDNYSHSPGGGNVKIQSKKKDYSGVSSKIGSKSNIEHKPGGGQVKIENKKVNLDNVRSKVGSLDKAHHKPGGGEKRIETQKLDWKAQSKVGSRDNEKHTPRGGEKKIESHKLEFKEKGKSKVGSLDNAHHVAGGGNVKVESHKLDFKEKGKSKIGSLDNAKHAPDGGEEKIEEQNLPSEENGAKGTDIREQEMAGTSQDVAPTE